MWDEILPLCREGEHGQGGSVTHCGPVMHCESAMEPSFCDKRTAGGLMFLSRKMGHIQTSACSSLKTKGREHTAERYLSWLVSVIFINELRETQLKEMIP